MRVEVKVCGLTRTSDARAAAELGARYLGVIFAGGPRMLDPERARLVLDGGGANVDRVGVFAAADVETIAATVNAAKLDIVQLHADPGSDMVHRVQAATGARVWAVLRLAGAPEPESLHELWDSADALVLDSKVKGVLGGSGVPFDWSAANARSARPAWPPGRRGRAHRRKRRRGDRHAFARHRRCFLGRRIRSRNQRPFAHGGVLRRCAPYRGTAMTATLTNDRFGAFGGRYVPETLIPALDDLEAALADAMSDSDFVAELDNLLATYVGRPSPLSDAPRLSELVGTPVLLKREDLNHTGAHKINNTVGQALLARRMGKRRIIAETGAGQHGVATATICARFGLECVVYMGEEDMRRQALNVFRMRLMGARVVPVSSGTKTLKDATTEAIRDWVTNVTDSHYIIGSVVGPAPYPRMVREFQAVIGREARAQMLAQVGRLPAAVVACVGGGSNAMGIFHPFVDDTDVELIGVEAAGEGLDTERHSASLSRGKPGVLHGARSYLLQDAAGQVHPAHSISAGLDYPGVGPEHSYLKDSGRAIYVSITDDEALEGLVTLSRLEGIIPALETAHAIAWVVKERARWSHGEPVLICVSGRGDKDVTQVSALLGDRIAS